MIADRTDFYGVQLTHDTYFSLDRNIGQGGGGCNPKKPNATANFKFGTGFFGFLCFFFFFFFFVFFSVFPFWPILTGLTGSC